MNQNRGHRAPHSALRAAHFHPEWGSRTYLMGIVNVTPDSFSGDGSLDPATAVAHAFHLAEQGADILDVGGESSRPGAHPVDPEEEARRVVPVIARLSKRVALPISVDTRHALVAEAALAAGATMINDVWGFRQDSELAHVASRHGAWAVAMHNRKAATTSAPGVGGYVAEASGDDVVEEVIRGLEASIVVLRAAGVRDDRVIVDPGFGFGKTAPQNLELIAQLGRLKPLGFPVLVGASRKSTIGIVLGGLPPDQRAEGTAALVALSIANGADMVRVHDLPAMARVARMTDAVVRGFARVKSEE